MKLPSVGLCRLDIAVGLESFLKKRIPWWYSPVFAKCLQLRSPLSHALRVSHETRHTVPISPQRLSPSEALKSGNAVLTSLAVGYNNLGIEGEQALRDAVNGRNGFELTL